MILPAILFLAWVKYHQAEALSAGAQSVAGWDIASPYNKKNLAAATGFLTSLGAAQQRANGVRTPRLRMV